MQRHHNPTASKSATSKGATSTGSVAKGGASSGVAASVNLSSSDRYTSIAEVGGRLVLYGPTGYPTTGSTCSAATVNPSTLALTGLVRASCANPATEGRVVVPVFTVEQGVAWTPGSSLSTVTVEISHTSAVVPSLQLGPVYMAGSPGYRLGPVVMSFPDRQLDGLFGPTATGTFGCTAQRRRTAASSCASSSTGVVVKEVAMPDITGPIFAIDGDGLWVAPPENNPGPAVYHVGLHASAAVPVFTLASGESTAWMVGSGGSVWIAVGTHTKGWALWELTGNDAVRHSYGTEVVTKQ